MSIQHNNIRKSEIKLINGNKWKFDFRENGYVIVSDINTVTVGKKDEVKWRVGLHGINIEACLQYIFTTYNGKCGILKYDELEDAA